MTFVPSKNVLKLWRISAAVVFAAVFSAVCYIPALNLKIKLIAAAVTAVLLCIVVFIYLPLLYRSEKIIVSDGRLYCKKGVIANREYIYPNRDIVYIQCFRLPVHSCFGLYIAVVKGVNNSIVLPPLSSEQLCSLKEVIKSEDR